MIIGAINENQAPVEVNVDLDLREPTPVDERTLDLHSDEVTDALNREAADIALGLVITLDVTNSTIGLCFDVLGDDDAEIFGKIAEVVKVVERETKFHLRLVRTEIAEIDAEEREADLARLCASDEIAAA